VFQDSPLAHVYPSERMTQELRGPLQNVFVLAPVPGKRNDAEGAIQGLVEMACHALSPSAFRPFTVLDCINWLAAGLRALTGQAIPSPFRYDEHGQLRVVAPATSFSQLGEACFSEIRHAADSPIVMIRLLEIARELARFARRSEDRNWLRSHIESIK